MGNNYPQLSKIIFYHSPCLRLFQPLKCCCSSNMPSKHSPQGLSSLPKMLFPKSNSFNLQSNVILSVKPYLFTFYKLVIPIQQPLPFLTLLCFAPNYLSPTIFICLLSLLLSPKIQVWESADFIFFTLWYSQCLEQCLAYMFNKYLWNK